jgi:hypothetical protein
MEIVKFFENYITIMKFEHKFDYKIVQLTRFLNKNYDRRKF